jgi:hypothetical protein
MTVWADNRLFDCPMATVTCHCCGGDVMVRKSSWNQTSVQWNTETSARCLERHADNAIACSRRGVFLACMALSESIVDGVRRGDVPIVDEIAEPVKNVAT